MDGLLSVFLLVGFAALVGLLAWRTVYIFWPYLLPLVAGLLLTAAGHVVLGWLTLLIGLFGGARFLEGKRVEFLLSRNKGRRSSTIAP